MIEGLDHIASLLRLYDIRTRLRHKTAAGECRTAVTEDFKSAFLFTLS